MIGEREAQDSVRGSFMRGMPRGVARVSAVITLVLGAAGGAPADTLIDNFESATFPANLQGGAWYVRAGNAGGAVPSIAQQRIAPGSGGSGMAYNATGAMPTLLAFVYGECGTELEPGADSDVNLSPFAALQFDIASTGGGPYQLRAEDSIHGSQCKVVALPALSPAMRRITMPLAAFTGGVYGTVLSACRALVWNPQANIGSAPFDLSIDNLRLLSTLPPQLDTAEDGDLVNDWSGAWRAYSGTTLNPTLATISCAVAAGGAGGSSSAVVISGTIPVADGSALYLGGGVCELEPGGDNAVNVSGFTTLAFDARSSTGGTYTVQIEDTSRGTGTRKVSFGPNTGFATVSIALSSFATGASATDLTKARAIRWSLPDTTQDSAGQVFNLVIDNVRFTGGASVDGWELF